MKTASCSGTQHVDPNPGSRGVRWCICQQYAWVSPVPMLRNPHPAAFGVVLAIRRTNYEGSALG